MFPKESKDKQIDQNTQNYLAKCNADCRGNILKNNDIFQKVRKKKSILKEKGAGWAIKSISIDSEVLFLRRKQFSETLNKVHAQKFDIWSKTYFLIYVVFNTHVNCYVLYIFKVRSYVVLFVKKGVFKSQVSFGASYIKTL